MSHYTRKRALIFLVLTVAGALSAAAAEEQSWSKRAPPPTKFAPPPAEQKATDWSGFHMGVNAGSGFGADNHNFTIPGQPNFPR